MNLPLFHYRHIIWDWNGTLLDDLELSVSAMNYLLGKRKLPLLSASQYKQFFRFPVADYYRQLGFDFAVEPFETLSTEFITAYNQDSCKCALHQGAARALETFRRAGLSQSILSAAHQDYLNEILNYHQIRSFFHRVVGLNHTQATSKAANAQHLIKELRCHPEEVLLIGDTLHDYEVSQAIGCHCLLLSNGHNTLERLQHCGVPVYQNLNDLITALSATRQKNAI